MPGRRLVCFLVVQIGEEMTVDVKHPEPPEGTPNPLEPPPRVRLGCIGSGHEVTEHYGLRELFAADQGLGAYDAEFDQVLESLHGNGVASFIVLRGIADYAEGRQCASTSATAEAASTATQTTNLWQPYAALTAAAFTRALVLKLQQEQGITELQLQ